MIQNMIISTMTLMGGMACYLIIDKKYEDGLIGRLSLIFMSGAALLMLMIAASDENLQLIDDVDTRVPAILIMVFLIAAAVFMGRHLYRYLRWRTSGEGAWRGKGK